MKNKYTENNKIWSKKRIFNERTLALQEMMKIAGKHFPETLPLIRMELKNERDRINRANIIRLRMSIIGH